ncbi:MAG: 50S ribosomal protein L28, partial [Roseovarius sp.]
GGLDKFLAKAKDVELSDNALKIKKAIAKSSATADVLS